MGFNVYGRLGSGIDHKDQGYSMPRYRSGVLCSMLLLVCCDHPGIRGVEHAQRPVECDCVLCTLLGMRCHALVVGIVRVHAQRGVVLWCTMYTWHAVALIAGISLVVQ